MEQSINAQQHNVVVAQPLKLQGKSREGEHEARGSACREPETDRDWHRSQKVDSLDQSQITVRSASKVPTDVSRMARVGTKARTLLSSLTCGSPASPAPGCLLHLVSLPKGANQGEAAATADLQPPDSAPTPTYPPA